MRLTRNKIDEIARGILGEDGLPLIKELLRQDNTSEFQLASRTKKDIKIIRKMLYLLYNQNMVCFTRKKDKEKGWYIYSWTLIPENVKYVYQKQKRETLARLQQKLEEERKELFFSCPHRCVRLNFDQATDFEFHCPECGELLGQDTAEEKIKGLEQRVSQLQKEISEIEEEKGKSKKPQVKKGKQKSVRRKAKKKR